MSSDEPILVRLVGRVQSFNARVLAIYNRRARGPLRFILGVLIYLARFYHRNIWSKIAYNKQGTRTWKRTLSALLVSVFLLFYFIPNMVVMGWHASLAAGTMQINHAFLTSSEEIDPENEIHSIRGCSRLPCSDSDALYYRAQSSWFNKAHSYLTRYRSFYPEEVAGVVAPGVNLCTTKSYGIRLKPLMRGWGIYPFMLDAECTPYTPIPGGPPITAEEAYMASLSQEKEQIPTLN